MNLSSIVFICSRLDLPGGTEKAIVNVANLFHSKGHDVTVIILDETKNVFFKVDPGIRIIRKGLHFGMTGKGNVITRKWAFRLHVRQLRTLLKELNASFIIATEYQFAIAAQMAASPAGMKVISWEHHHVHELKKSRFWEWLYKTTYPKLHRVVCLNPDEAGEFLKMGCSTTVIPNFVEQAILSHGQRSNTILTVARLSYVKGIDRLVEIAAAVLKRYKDWKWKIIGEGEMQIQITQVIEELSLDGRLIHQLPSGPNLDSEYTNASIYVMTSRHECFPMVLLEAMSHGTPCIAFNCETGPRHIIQNGKDGILIEQGNTEQMISAINELVEDGNKRLNMGEKAREHVQRFSPELIYAEWRRLFNKPDRTNPG